MIAMDITVDIQHLLHETVTRYVSPQARISSVERLPIDPGVSKVNVQRYAIQLDQGTSESTAIQLVTKPAPLVERQTLALLHAQGHAIVPFNYTHDLTTDAPALVCMQDVGTDLIEDATHFTEPTARGLAAIHATNLGAAESLVWLPRTDRAYFTEFIVRLCWRQAWDRALADPQFVHEFRKYLAPVEAAVEQFPDMILALDHEGDLLTLIHSDIYYGHVLAYNGSPYIIDWGQAHYGSLYLDLPSHFRTLEQALQYRACLAELGVAIPQDHFTERYRIAAQFAAIRYMWWWIAQWRREHADWQKAGLIEMFQWTMMV